MNEYDGQTVALRGFSQQPVADEVTVCVPGSALAPAPSALVTRAVRLEDAPVFVDDSGTRKRLLRFVGVVVALLSLGFLTLVGVAVAVPSVATSVGLDGVVPFLVPGAAAKPPPPAPIAPIAHVVPRFHRVPTVVKPQPATHPTHTGPSAGDAGHRGGTPGHDGSGSATTDGTTTDGTTTGTTTDGTTDGTKTGGTKTDGTDGTTAGTTTDGTTTGGTKTDGTTTGTTTDGVKTDGTALGAAAEKVATAPVVLDQNG